MSMPMDPYAGGAVRDPIRVIQELSARIAALEARAGIRTGVPVTRTSGPLFLPNGAASTPSGGAYLYASGGSLYMRTSGGSDYSLIPPELPQAESVTVDTISIPNAPAVYDQDHSATLRLMIFRLNNALTATLAELKASGQMKSF